MIESEAYLTVKQFIPAGVASCARHGHWPRFRAAMFPQKNAGPAEPRSIKPQKGVSD
jgi:hypothetical protein